MYTVAATFLLFVHSSRAPRLSIVNTSLVVIGTFIVVSTAVFISVRVKEQEGSSPSSAGPLG